MSQIMFFKHETRGKNCDSVCEKQENGFGKV